jgi:methylenetetrahydrofolate dehydrogenase (NADP+)/methenyltetrahydrofolate cyclohydrolase
MSEIIKGKILAQNIQEKTKAKIAKLAQPPGLAAILVGKDSASKLYVSLKEKAAKEVGIYFEKIVFPASASTKQIVAKIQELNARGDIQGILVQFPLPKQDENKIVAAIDPAKDVDGFHRVNRDKLAAGEKSLVPPVALAVVRLIQASNQPLAGKHAVIIGNSAIFAEPIIHLLKESGVNTILLTRDESALAAKTRAADIIVVAIGQANFLTRNMVKEGAIVIDVGTNRLEGQLVGDAAPDLIGHAGFVSPVPGGVGPLTVAYLLNNVLKAATK